MEKYVSMMGEPRLDVVWKRVWNPNPKNVRGNRHMNRHKEQEQATSGTTRGTNLYLIGVDTNT